MIVEIIAKYLESNKRLVVPNLGTFIVKVPQQAVLFSNLMKSDDGVLRSVIVKSGVSELDAAALIDRFVFEVNDRLAKGGVCALSGFGVLRSGANGTVGFTFDVKAKGDVLDNDASEKLEAHLAAKTVENPETTSQVEEKESHDEEDMVIDVVPRIEPTVAESHSQEAELIRKPMAAQDETRVRERRQHSKEDYVKGLRYGKGRKVVTGREGATSRKSSKSKFIIIFALIAALLAILAISYGMYNDWRNHQFLYEGLYDEPAEAVTSTAEEGVRNPDLDYITPN